MWFSTRGLENATEVRTTDTHPRKDSEDPEPFSRLTVAVCGVGTYDDKGCSSTLLMVEVVVVPGEGLAISDSPAKGR